MELKPIQLDEDKSSEIYASSDCQTVLKMYEDFYPKVGFNPPWVGYFVVRNNQIVGLCSFIGKPDDGRVEISYWTFSEFEGQGIASFSCEELISIARNADPKVTITAKTQPEHNASTRILEKKGLQFSEVVQDEEIGDAWLWILP